MSQTWQITSTWCEGWITWHSRSSQQTSQSNKHWTLNHIQRRLMKSKATLKNNNIKQIRNKKLITEIWTETKTFLLLQLKYHFLKAGQTRLCHNKKIINIILIINILQNQNQQCNKKVFNPSLSRREGEREREREDEGRGLAARKRENKR